jgi:uncharacterized protein YjbI with pentapeptide repeats
MARSPEKAAATAKSAPPRAEKPEPPPSDPKLQELKDQAEDLGAARKALDDAVSMTRGLWISFISLSALLAITVGAVTHVDLFLENPLQLPLINIKLPIVGFFWIAPLLYLIVHAYLLLNLKLMADNVRTWVARLQLAFPAKLDAELRERISDELKMALPNFFPVQMLAAPRMNRRGIMRLALAASVMITVVVGPVVLLFLVQGQFLPYHNEIVTWVHRAAVLADLTLLWYFWPRIRGIEVFKQHWILKALAAHATIFVGFLSIFIANFPGESIYSNPATNVMIRFLSIKQRCLMSGVPRSVAFMGPPAPDCPERSIRTAVFDGPIDQITGLQQSLFSNRLVLINQDFTSADPKDPKKGLNKISLRGRHLEKAVLVQAVLKRADLTGADLTGADLSDANLSDADFEKAILVKAVANNANFSGAIFTAADLDNADFTGANLSHSSLRRIFIRKINLAKADLSGARIDMSFFSNVDFSNCKMVGSFVSTSIFVDSIFDNCNIRWANFRKSLIHRSFMRRMKASFAIFDKSFFVDSDFTESFFEYTIFEFSYLDRISSDKNVKLPSSFISLHELAGDKLKENTINSEKIAENYRSDLKKIFDDFNNFGDSDLDVYSYQKYMVGTVIRFPDWISKYKEKSTGAYYFDHSISRTLKSESEVLANVWQKRLFYIQLEFCQPILESKIVDFLVTKEDGNGIGGISINGPYRRALVEYLLDKDKCPPSEGLSEEARKKLLSWSSDYRKFKGKSAADCDLAVPESYPSPYFLRGGIGEIAESSCDLVSTSQPSATSSLPLRPR